MNYAEIKNFDIANGLGIRVSLFVSGCTHRCKNCFNSIAWDFNYGKPFTKEVEDSIIEMLSKPSVSGLTLLGGEPMEPVNQMGLIDFLRRVKKEVPNKNIWCYTGYTLEQIFSTIATDNFDIRVYKQEIIKMCDVLVDGRYVDELRDLTLRFRGSSNQRVIDVKQTLNENKIILYDN